MKQYVIMYNSIDNRNSLLYDYETIEGKNPKDALNKRFDVDFERLTGESGRYAEIIIMGGHYDKESNNIYYTGKGLRLCYSRL